MATILLVEDDEQVRKLVTKRLKAAGHKVAAVRDAEAALERYGDSAPDVVVTDLVLPGKDGQALITDLLLAAPAARIIAISGATGQNVQELLQEASLRGAVRTLPKPFTTDQLLEAVDAALAG
jgi:CheY-like chemotaxis protein